MLTIAWFICAISAILNASIGDIQSANTFLAAAWVILAIETCERNRKNELPNLQIHNGS